MRRPRARTRGPVVAVVLAGVLTGCLPEPGTVIPTTPSASQPTEEVEGPTFRPVTCDGESRRAYIQGDALPPRCGDGGWIFVLPATEAPLTRRRSEVFLGGRDPRPFEVGDRVHLTARVRAELGDAADTTTDWHVLWQIVGQTHGRWKGPAVSLVVADGRLALTGGNGHPEHSPGGEPSYQWNRRLADFENGREYRVELEIHLDPEDGWVTADVDGRRVLDRFVPVSPSGHRPGTINPGQDTLHERIGLYRGTDGADPPTYEQRARVVVEVEQVEHAGA